MNLTDAQALLALLSTHRRGNGNAMRVHAAHFLVDLALPERPSHADFARRMKISQSAVSMMAGELERTGYIARFRPEDDRRAVCSVLTEKGRAFVDQIKALGVEAPLRAA